jgi:toluene monooxygenase system ferredoxin subunit
MDISGILERVHIFKGLSQEALNSLAQLCRHREYNAKDIIFTEKSKGKEMYIVVKGQVCIELGVKGPSDFATVQRVGEGDIFGELAIVSKGGRSASARCETNCDIIVIDGDDILALFQKNTSIGYPVMKNFASLLANRLRKTNLQLVASILWE